MGKNIKINRSQIIKLFILLVSVLIAVISFDFIFRDWLNGLTKNQVLMSALIITLIVIVVFSVGIYKILKSTEEQMSKEGMRVFKK
ncbi:MAG: hypothetical protein ABH830_01520 [Patescibacteria group bacterium]